MDQMRDEAVRLGWVPGAQYRQPDDLPADYYPNRGVARPAAGPATPPDENEPAIAQAINAHRGPVQSQEQWDAVLEDFVEGAADKHGSQGQLFGQDDEDEDY